MTRKRYNKGQSPSRFQPGDRVKLKQAGRMYIVREFASKELKDRVNNIHNTEKIGTVKEIFTKETKNGSQFHYARVLWDMCKVPSEHHQMRLMLYPSQESAD